MRWFRRQPVVYDLWADIRFFWAWADYLEARHWAWERLMNHNFFAQPVLAGSIENKATRTIEFYRYERLG